MKIDQAAFNQIATTLARHFDSLYYVEIETGNYCEFVSARMLEGMNIPEEGDDFFARSKENAHKVVHPDDLERVLKFHDKDTILYNLALHDSYTLACRLILNGEIVHIRHIDIMCEDRKHIIFCMENVEEEHREKEEQRKNLRSAERMARRDELTGIKNKKAFSEASRSIDEILRSDENGFHFGIVVCDVNDLKLINDTRGHSFGDEALQRASHMICDVFKHSPVFRIGGDEFAVIISGADYEQGENLTEQLIGESITNGRSSSGPVVACGMAKYDPEKDFGFASVFKRADRLMYDNKSDLKARKAADELKKTGGRIKTIPEKLKRKLDVMFGAYYTIAGEGYVFLTDLKYDFSRWSLPLIDDFKLESEYMYHVENIWKDYIHPEDLNAYQDAVNLLMSGSPEVRPLCYRARKADGTYVPLRTRGFVLNDEKGSPAYFGGILIPQ